MNVEDRPPAVSVGVDLGGTATRFVSLDAEGRINRQLIVSTPAEATGDDAIRFLVDHIGQLGHHAHLESIGIGASGPIDAGGIIRNSETLPAFSGIDILAGVEAGLGLRPTIDNDAVTAAIGEHRLGAGRSARDMLMVTLGTGVGVCLLQNGIPFRGADGRHPEASHISVGGPPAPCYCGRTTCWEQTASRRALQDAASALAEHPSHSSHDIDRAETLALAGDTDALALFADYGRTLAEGLADLIAIYEPHRVVIGGSGSSYLPSYGHALRESLGRIAGLDVAMVVAAQLGEFGGAIGAALVG